MHKVAPLDSEQSAINIIHHQQIIHASLQPNEATKVCKICLEDEFTDLGILIQMTETQQRQIQLMVPCECSGSVGYVHHKCIRTWIQKQLLLGSGKKEVYCQICKAQLYFILKKHSYCECSFRHLSLISGCNIMSTMVQLFLLVLAAVILRYSPNISQSKMLRYALIVLICILAVAVVLSVLLMIGQACVKSKKQISKIFSLQQSQQLGLRQVRVKSRLNLLRSTRNFPRTTNNISQRSGVKKTGKNKIANLHFQAMNPPISSPLPFMEINSPITEQVI